MPPRAPRGAVTRVTVESPKGIDVRTTSPRIGNWATGRSVVANADGFVVGPRYDAKFRSENAEFFSTGTTRSAGIARSA